MNKFMIIVTSLVMFGVGYGLLSWVLNLFSGKKLEPRPPQQQALSSTPTPPQPIYYRPGAKPAADAAGIKDEAFYARVLGLGEHYSWEEVQKKFRELAAQYAPDRIAHMGEKIRQVAAAENAQLCEAYVFFERKFGMIPQQP